MNTQEVIDGVKGRIEAHRPAFEARWPAREIEFVVLSHFGNTVMDLLIDKGGIEKGKVREFTLKRIKEIDPTLKSDLVSDRDDKELRASVQLGIERIGEEFPDLLYAALQAEWTKIDQEWEARSSRE